MYAIEQAARAGDESAIRDIVQQLDSDDPAVRLLAIGALERLTGRTLGYQHGDPPKQRARAVARWEAFVEHHDGALPDPHSFAGNADG